MVCPLCFLIAHIFDGLHCWPALMALTALAAWGQVACLDGLLWMARLLLTPALIACISMACTDGLL
jgi:hypothetical protein